MLDRRFMVCLCVCLLGAFHLTVACDDLDTQACEYMAASRPSFCYEDDVAKTACTKFCKLCPVTCFNCNSTLTDYHRCSNIVTCQIGEVCMRRELKSFVDGHREYEMTCAKKTFCDDPWQVVSTFGKRNIQSRDVSITCCATDLCNYPMASTTTSSSTTTKTTTTTTTTTTTAVPSTTTDHSCKECCKDVMISVDESGSMNQTTVKQFLQEIVSRLPIGPDGTLVSLGLFTTHGREIFGIGDHLTKSSTNAAIHHVRFRGGHGVITAGVDYLLDRATTPQGGDRPEYPNIALVLTDDKVSSIAFSKEYELHSKAQHVISIEIGSTQYRHLASDSRYQFEVQNASDLLSLPTHIVSLICEVSTGSHWHHSSIFG